jgi:hypothetical protein
LGSGYEPVVGPTPSGGVALGWRKPGGELHALFSTSGDTYVIIGPDRQVMRQGTITHYSTFLLEVLKRWL